jgi:hypothetical protein
MVEQEIILHDKNIEQYDEINRFLKDKFTNKDLYQWMSNQLSGLYFQTYKIAYDLAKAVERAFQYETGIDDIYINYGHWDSLKKGLLAAERLILELNQLEMGYLNHNSRSFEIEKVISLRNLSPQSLYDLRTRGECVFYFTEKLFDLDFPGHYFRKIKNISISIPLVAGPYENVKAILTQVDYRILKKADIDGVKYLFDNTTGSNSNVIEYLGATQQIAVSRAVNESGMFELNFRDERYLPFEETGAVSSWKLEMPKASNHFDYDSISDVIINLKYTALSDGQLKIDVIALPAMKELSGYRALSLRTEFSTEWHEFLNPPTEFDKHQMIVSVSDKNFPPNIKNIFLTGVFAKLKLDEILYDDDQKLFIGGILNITMKVHMIDSSSIRTFKFEDGKTDTIEKNINQKLEDISNLEISIERKKSNDPSKPDIPSKLRKKNDDGSDVVETINGIDHYFLDPKLIKNIGLILLFQGDLQW